MGISEVESDVVKDGGASIEEIVEYSSSVLCCVNTTATYDGVKRLTWCRQDNQGAGGTHHHFVAHFRS